MMFACGSLGSGVRPEDRFHCNFIVFCKGFFLFRYLFFNEFIGRFCFFQVAGFLCRGLNISLLQFFLSLNGKMFL